MAWIDARSELIRPRLRNHADFRITRWPSQGPSAALAALHAPLMPGQILVDPLDLN